MDAGARQEGRLLVEVLVEDGRHLSLGSEWMIGRGECSNGRDWPGWLLYPTRVRGVKYG